MTKSTRWGLSALFITGGLALGAAFSGCGDDDAPNPPPTTTDSGVDSPADTTDTAVVTEGGTDAADTSDTPATAKADRKITLLFAAPDLKPQFVCLGAWLSLADVTAGKDPLSANGPFGITPTGKLPEPTKDDVTKYAGFPYGATVPFPVYTPDVIAALDGLAVVGWILDDNPGVTYASAGKTGWCKSSWKDVKANPKRQLSVDKATVKKGESWAAIIRGCEGGPQATGECGATGLNLEFVTQKLDIADKGSGKMGVQFLHESQFPGATGLIPPFQGVDVYLQAMSAAGGGDAGTDGGTDTGDTGGDTSVSKPTPVGTPVAIGGTGTTAGLKYKDVVDPSLAIDALGGDPNEALLIVAVHGTTPCLGGPSTTCTTAVTIPLKKFLAAAAIGDPSSKPAAGINLILGLAGSPAPKTTGDPTTAPLRVLIGNSKIPTIDFPL